MTTHRNLESEIEEGNLDKLVRLADSMGLAGQWDDLVVFRRRCLSATESGRQLWPIAARIDFLLALGAPPEIAVTSLGSSATRFAPGPITEVIAARHTWSSIADLIHDSYAASTVAQERVLRGEDLRAENHPATDLVELPRQLTRWEPEYALAEYGIREVTFPPPHLEKSVLEELPIPRGEVSPRTAPPVVAALRELTSTWDTESNGRTEVVAVHGRMADALRALGPPSVRAAEISTGDAFALMAWAGASGGAYGRRPGGASGRFSAWWAASAITGLNWPPDKDSLIVALGDIRWWRWDPGAPSTGWSLRLAFEDMRNGIAGAIDAVDAT